MKAETYYLETFGCQMNVLDSELVAGQLRRLGLVPVSEPPRADVVLFNTCSVRRHAEDKVLSRLGQLKALKRRRPEMIIAVIGCMAERMGADLLAQTPQVDLVCGPGELDRLPTLISEIRAGGGPRVALSGTGRGRRDDAGRRAADDRIELLDLARTPVPGAAVLQSYVRVQRGCDKFCTYCVVPFVRGPERSRPAANIVAEVTRLAEDGCREVTLLGQTVNSYRFADDHQTVSLARLLERVQAVPGIDRVRFVTSFPADWDDDIFRVMRDYPKVMPYLHIPAQSGSDHILRAMCRGYTVAEYLRLMDAARQYVPGIGLAGDFIVGFCGETAEDFRATVALVQRVEYQNIFVFKYSPRPGTSAERVKDDDVPLDVKAARNNELLAVQSEIAHRHKRTLVGGTCEVLVEGYSKVAQRAQRAAEAEQPCEESAPEFAGPAGTARGDQLVGRTPTDQIVVFDGRPEHVGALVRVRIEAVSPLTLFGRLEAVVAPPRTPARGALPILGPD